MFGSLKSPTLSATLEDESDDDEEDNEKDAENDNEEGGEKEEEEEEEDEPEEAGWQLAKRAIDMALNNKVDEALRLLRSAAALEDSSRGGGGEIAGMQAQAGLAFLTFMNAVMTFEEEKMSLALSTLRATEKRCSGIHPSRGPSSSFFLWPPRPRASLTPSPSMSSLQGMKSRVQGLLGVATTTMVTEEEERTKQQENVGEEVSLRLERQIIVADCQVLEAIVNFLRQDWSSYVKGGWVLRKAWKVYQRTYEQIRQIYMRKIGVGGGGIAPPLPPSWGHFPTQSAEQSSPTENGDAVANGPSLRRQRRGGGGRGPKGFGLTQSVSMPLGFLSRGKPGGSSFSPANSTGSDAESSSSSSSTSSVDEGMSISCQTIRRLMSAVSFGFGLFHLAVSLLPPKLLGVVHLLGFDGDRQTGIQALHFSRQGCDMRGPIATLALLWFHTIVRPFFGLDGSNLKSGADAAQRLIDASKPDFARSALFLFFQGRVQRLKSDFTDALQSYELALSVSAQREVRLLCLHEVGWSYLLLLQWDKASQAFLQLKNESRWSPSLYCYISSICLGCSGDIDKCLEMAQETPRLVRRASSNQLEKFLLRRANKMLADKPDQHYCLILAYELLYLWNALGACLKHSCEAIQIDCQRLSVVVAPLEGVRLLILGSIHGDSGHVDEAKLWYTKAMKQAEKEEEEGASSYSYSTRGNSQRGGGGGEIHAAAFAAYELGLLLCRDHKTRSVGRRYLEYARDKYRDYDFESRLNVRIEAALRYHSANDNERCAQALLSN